MSGEPGRDFATPDDPAHCHLCGKVTSTAMIARHLEEAHGIDPQELADAPVIDAEEEFPLDDEDDPSDLPDEDLVRWRAKHPVRKPNELDPED